jgi:hypothetical protein
MLERLMETRTWIEGERRNRMVRFWYDRSERPSEDYVALDATYLMYMLGNAPFPKLACDETIQPDTVVVIPSASAHVAGTAIGALSECASRAALRPNVAGSRTSAHPGGAYTTVLLTLDRDPSKWQHVRPVFDAPGKGALELTGYSAAPAAPFPPERWTAMYTDLGTQLHLGTDGTTLLTPKSAHAGAAFYGPLTAPAAGRYHFAMRFRPQSGVFAFGVGSGDGATWLATDVVGHRAGLDMERECWVDLEKGQEFRIGIANNNTVNIPASLVIKEITAWAIIGR